MWVLGFMAVHWAYGRGSISCNRDGDDIATSLEWITIFMPTVCSWGGEKLEILGGPGVN